MRKKIKSSLAFLLILLIAIGMMPTRALALNPELVLTQIGHSSCPSSVSISNPSTREITLTVPNSYSAPTLDLSTNLIISKASNISEVTTTFSPGASVTVGGTAVAMTVWYKRSNNTSDSTVYSITVIKAAMKNPTFSGTITKSFPSTVLTTAENDIPFSLSDFNSVYTANDGGGIGTISITGTHNTCGALKYYDTSLPTPAYRILNSGETIAAANIGYLVFDAVAAGSVTYLVNVYATNNPTIAIGPVSLNITVSSVTAPTITSTVNKSVAAGSTATFSLIDFNSHYNLNSGILAGIEITPINSGSGTWYNGSTPITYATVFDASTIGNLRFVGGTAGTATFSWRVSNQSGYSALSTGTITIGTTSGNNLSYSTTSNTAVSFRASDFSNAFYSTTGTFLSSVSFSLPQSYYGTLYSGSNPVLANTLYYTGFSQFGQSIDSISFIPASNYTGTVNIAYTGYSSGGISITGYVQIIVGGSNTGTLSYTTPKNTAVSFKSSDFYSAFYISTGTALSYVSFALPQAYNGTLYYNTTNSGNNLVYANTPYYVGSMSNQSLDYVSFVPATNYTGTFTIAYTGYSAGGSTYSGSIQINVGTSSSGYMTYTTEENTPIKFKSSDIYSAFNNATGSALSYVFFTVPASSSGTLYYNYESTLTTNPVAATTPYYVGIAPYLDYVTFVPANNYKGTVTITYTGYNVNGVSTSGSIQINVGTSGSSSVKYTTAKNTAVTFRSSDFSTAFYTATGTSLSQVFFTLPSSSYGTLYFNYATSLTSNPVSPVTPYYTGNTPLLDYVTFVPANNYTGTITIAYTGYNANGITTTGTIQINVGTSGSGAISYTTAKNTAVTFRSSDFTTTFYNATGTTLSQVFFTLPSASSGTLYNNYSTSLTANPVSPVTAYYTGFTPLLDSVSFLPANNYTGTVTITYTGYNANGVTTTGTIQINVGTSGSGAISYTTGKNTAVTFRSSDFTTAFYNATGTTLSQVFFMLPSVSSGTLYNNYSTSLTTNPVSPVTAYYTGFTPLLDSVSFVPANNYTGTVTITYTGYNANSVATTGTIQINVGTSGSGAISYTTEKNTAVTFRSSDFTSAFYSATGTSLSHVFFTLPSASYGTLYYNYSSTSTANPVSAITSFYTGSTPLLDSITFVPAINYTGTVTIAYTGYSTNGSVSAGTVQIIVGSSNTCSINYSTDKNTAILFKASDFSSAFNTASGSALSYVYFTPPSSSSGTLYYNYIATSAFNTAVSSTSQYNVNTTPYLSYITFVPAANFIGTVTIPFKGYSINGSTCSGSVTITIKVAAAAALLFTDIGSYSWATEAINYLSKNDIITGTGSMLFSPSKDIKRGDFILMLYRAFDFKGSPSSNFNDVPRTSYYYEAIAAAKASGITRETGNYFNPEEPLTRQDAMYFTYRALQVSGSTLVAGSGSDISKFTDKNEISDYALSAVQTLVKAGIIKGSSSKLSPLGNLNRAEMAVILYRALTV